MRKGIAPCDGRDLFGGVQPWPDGAYPGSERLPDQPGMGCGEDPQEALCDESEMDVAMPGVDLAAYSGEVGHRFR